MNKTGYQVPYASACNGEEGVANRIELGRFGERYSGRSFFLRRERCPDLTCRERAAFSIGDEPIVFLI